MTDATETLPEISDLDLAAMTDEELADMLTGFATGIHINMLLNKSLVESARRLREGSRVGPKPAGAECYTDEQGREICVLPRREKEIEADHSNFPDCACFTCQRSRARDAREKKKCSSTAPAATSRSSRSRAKK